MVQITVVKLYLAFFCKFAIMLRCISRQITQIGVHISWKIISRPVVISALFLCCHSVIPVDGLLSNGCQWRCVQWTSLVPSFPFFTRWHIPPSPFPFLSLWSGTFPLHVPVLRPPSRAGLMHGLRGGISIVLRDTIKLAWWCLLSVDAERPLFLRERCVYGLREGIGKALCHDI